MAPYFLDTSALVKHYHAEAGAARVDAVLREPAAELLISRLTLVETLSVFAIKVRTGEFDTAEFARLRGLFSTHVAHRFYLVSRLLNADYERARNLLSNHGLSRQLRTLDALQLAVALRLHQAIPLDHFVCADQRLCAIAALEGLSSTIWIEDLRIDELRQSGGNVKAELLLAIFTNNHDISD